MIYLHIPMEIIRALSYRSIITKLSDDTHICHIGEDYPQTTANTYNGDEKNPNTSRGTEEHQDLFPLNLHLQHL